MLKVSMWVVMVAGLTAFTGCGDDAKPAADTSADTMRADTAGADEQDGSPDDASETEQDTEPSPDSGGSVTPQVVESDGWLLTAETPTLSPEGDMVQGAVTFTRVSGAATRGGGACLVADLHDATPCADSAECDAALPPLGPGGAYYCAAIDGQGPKRCWTRPSNNCTRDPARVPGTYTTLPEPALLDGQPTLWATYACMADESLATGCASTDPALYVSTLSPTLLLTP